jgi:hypothetical protein
MALPINRLIMVQKKVAMKKRQIQAGLLSSAMIWLLMACSEDYPERTPSPEVASNCMEVYFPKTMENLEVELEVTGLSVTVARLDSTKAVDVPLTVVQNDSNVFKVPQSVHFAANQSQATIQISFPDAQIAVYYTLELKLEGKEFVNPYKNSPTFALTLAKLKWEKFATGLFTSEFFGASWPQDLYHAIKTNRYRFFDLWVTGYHYDFFWETDKSTITPAGTLDSETGLYVQPSGYDDPTYGMIMTNTSPAESLTFYDPEKALFTFNIEWTVDLGSFGISNETYQITSLVTEEAVVKPAVGNRLNH